jgi:hypothetical protein
MKRDMGVVPEILGIEETSHPEFGDEEKRGTPDFGRLAFPMEVSGDILVNGSGASKTGRSQMEFGNKGNGEQAFGDEGKKAHSSLCRL